MHRCVISIVAVILAFSVSFAVAAGEKRNVRVGVSLSLTGDYMESGRKALAGVKLRVEDFNAQPENDKRIELVVLDDRSDSQTARENVATLAREDIHALIGPLSTGLMLAMRDEAEKHKMVMISPSVTSPKIGKDKDWAFRVLFDDEFQGVALARFLAGRQKITRAAVAINDKFAYAESMFQAFAAEFAQLGGEIVAEEHYTWTAGDSEKMFDFSEILGRIDQAGADIVLLPIHSLEVAAAIRRSTQMGLKMRFCGGDTWQHENVLLSSGNNLEDSYFISGIDVDADTPEMRHFKQLYDNSNDPDAQFTSVLGYDAASVLIKGLESGDSGEAIRDGLYAIRDFPLASGVMSVRPGHGSEKSAYIHHIAMRDGNFESRIIDEIIPCSRLRRKSGIFGARRVCDAPQSISRAEIGVIFVAQLSEQLL